MTRKLGGASHYVIFRYNSQRIMVGDRETTQTKDVIKKKKLIEKEKFDIHMNNKMYSITTYIT